MELEERLFFALNQASEGLKRAAKHLRDKGDEEAAKCFDFECEEAEKVLGYKVDIRTIILCIAERPQE